MRRWRTPRAAAARPGIDRPLARGRRRHRGGHAVGTVDHAIASLVAIAPLTLSGLHARTAADVVG